MSSSTETNSLVFESPQKSPSHNRTAILCFSHLRWDFVFQRPQHLMTRFAATMIIWFWEEALILHSCSLPYLKVREVQENITIITPIFPEGTSLNETDGILEQLLFHYLDGRNVNVIRWYYTPLMLQFSRSVNAICTIYDCMDELANFKFAPSAIVPLERELFTVADLVFTGGHSLYEAKCDQHAAVYPFPSGVDRFHFSQALQRLGDPSDQVGVPHPRLGFFGVVDERMDLELLWKVAHQRPAWSIIVVGPVAKIDPRELPRLPNIHYLGWKAYDELPAYAGSWDVALMPFALDKSTRFISPTKTPEYLAAGLPVVSTAIADVVRHYGQLEAVKIATDADGFIGACEEALQLMKSGVREWRRDVDLMLAHLSWDNVSSQMMALIHERVTLRHAVQKPHYDYLVVGAGFAGSVMAERLARDGGKRVLIIDKRPHIGGNAYDHLDDAGILIHRYGPHVFHTNSTEIVEYLSRFTDWRPYEHRVLANVDSKLLPIPINRTTINSIYDLKLSTEAEVDDFLSSQAERVDCIRTSEDVVVSQIGRKLYEAFFRGYTRKQWGLDPSELDKAVTARIPTRLNNDDRYFNDSFQAMPAAGFTAMFERMLDHPNIEVRLGIEYSDVRESIEFGSLVYTGPIDEYFEHCYGKLPYRSLEFQHQTIDQEWFQPVAVVNFPSETVSHTRITEYKHLTGQRSAKTSISYEFPVGNGQPYYPIPRPANQALYQRYRSLALAEPDVMFVGRLATYRYYNMDQVVGQALAAYHRHKATLESEANAVSSLKALEGAE